MGGVGCQDARNTPELQPAAVRAPGSISLHLFSARHPALAACNARQPPHRPSACMKMTLHLPWLLLRSTRNQSCTPSHLAGRPSRPLVPTRTSSRCPLAAPRTGAPGSRRSSCGTSAAPPRSGPPAVPSSGCTPGGAHCKGSGVCCQRRCHPSCPAPPWCSPPAHPAPVAATDRLSPSA